MTYSTTDDDKALATDLGKIGERDLTGGVDALGDLLDTDAHNALRGALDEGGKAIRGAMLEAQRASNDPMIPEAGRAHVKAQQAERAQKAFEAARDGARSAVAAQRQKLIAAAAPVEPTDPHARAELRTEVKMILDATEDAENGILSILLGADRELAAVAYGSFGRRWLASRGVRVDADMQKALDAALITGSRQHGDEKAKRAAAALAQGGAADLLTKGMGASLTGLASLMGK